MKKPLLGKLLLENNEITQEQLDAAIKTQAKNGGLIGIILIIQGAITESTLISYLAIQADKITSASS